MTIVDDLLTIDADVTIDPFFTGSPTPSGAIVTVPGRGIIFVTSEGTGYAVGIYGSDFAAEEDPYTVVDVSAERVAAVVLYLATEQPEGTEWCAWAAQRLDDDGEGRRPMTGDLLDRIRDQASDLGELILTAEEAEDLAQLRAMLSPNAALIIAGRPVELGALTVHVLPAL